MIERRQIIDQLQTTLESLPFVYAMWQGGAAAWNRVDQWSDIDIQVDVGDEKIEEVFNVIATALTELAPIYLCYRIPQPTWHGHDQAIYRLENTSEFLIIDLVIMKHSAINRFNEQERHGTPIVHFDKSGVVKQASLNKEKLKETLEKHLIKLRTTFELFQILTKKEILRNHPLEAIPYYHNFTLRPLVELIRIQHCPQRHMFYLRYIDKDLPEEVSQKLEPLYFVGSLAELRQRRQEAEEWFYQIYKEIKIDLENINW